MPLTKTLTRGPAGTSVARAGEETVGSAGGTDPTVRQDVSRPGAGHACRHGQESTPPRQLPSGRSYHSRNHTTCPSPNDSPGATREFSLGARQPAAPDTSQALPEFEVRTDAARPGKGLWLVCCPAGSRAGSRLRGGARIRPFPNAWAGRSPRKTSGARLQGAAGTPARSSLAASLQSCTVYWCG
jgi:hypothetical protein